MSTRGLDVTAVSCSLTSERPPRPKVNIRRSTLKIYRSGTLGVSLPGLGPGPRDRPAAFRPRLTELRVAAAAAAPARFSRRRPEETQFPWPWRAMAVAISVVITSDCCSGPRRRIYSLSVNVARCREQLMLEFCEKPLARSPAVAGAGANPDADRHDRSVPGLRWQALRPRAYLGRSCRVRRCPSDRWHQPVIRRDSRPASGS
jgi:hypothetical protein